jgi:hypothetical protein
MANLLHLPLKEVMHNQLLVFRGIIFLVFIQTQFAITSKEHSLFAHRRRKVHFLNHYHLYSCLKWAKAHTSWSVEDQGKVIFSDESKFNLFSSDGLQYCWRKRGEALDSYYTNRQVKEEEHGGGEVMVLGCVLIDGVGQLYKIDGNMDTKKYIFILKEACLGALGNLHANPQGFVLQADNDPKCTTKVT